MINFKAIPFLKILFPFITGITCVFVFGMFPNIHLVCSGAFLLMIAAFLFQKYYKPVFYLKKGIYIFSVNMFLFFLAFESCFLYNAKNDPHHYTHFINLNKHKLIGTVDDLPSGSGKSTKLSVQLECISDCERWHYATGHIMVYLKKESSKVPEPGDRILIDSRLNSVDAPKNPDEFNYKEFLENRNIFHTAYVMPQELAILGAIERPFSFIKFATRIKSYVVSTLRHSGLSQDAFAICSALLVGYDDEIDRDVMQSFSHSGTLHILSVSGMHTGVLYAILVFVFGLFDKYDRYKKIKCFFVILFLFLFVGITGFSPSVLRAALMLSLILSGKTFYKQGNSYNTLLLSAFLLLLYNPYLLKDIGFLLSYLAVFGIMYFYPVLNKVYVFENKVLQWIWASMLISVSATLFTLPVSLYYFHQFPTWFVLSNMVIIPISMGVMSGAVLLLFFSKFLLVKQFLVCAVNAATSLMLWCAKLTDEAGYGFIDYISFSKFDLICCALLLLSFLFVLATKQYRQALAFCVTCIVWLSGSVLDRYTHTQNAELVVFHVKNKPAFACKVGHRVYCDFHELNEKEFRRSVKPYLLQIPGLEIVHTSVNLLKHKRCSILQVKGAVPTTTMNADYILVSHDAGISLTINDKSTSVVIADCSNSYNFVKKLKKQCLQLGIPFYSVKESGALKLNI